MVPGVRAGGAGGVLAGEARLRLRAWFAREATDKNGGHRVGALPSVFFALRKLVVPASGQQLVVAQELPA